MRSPVPVPAVLPAAVTVVVAALVAAGVAGCAAPAPPPAGSTTPSAGSTGSATSSAAALPWPARSAAEAAGLQQAADGGAQPWLLDPEETALSYVAATSGWTTAGTERTAPDRVLVTGPGGARRTLVLVQPARPGPGGIWSVTAELEAPIG